MLDIIWFDHSGGFNIYYKTLKTQIDKYYMSCDCFDISLKSLRNCWLSGSALTVSAISQRLIYTQPAPAPGCSLLSTACLGNYWITLQEGLRCELAVEITW